jgi:hypothetical protein
MGAQAAGVGASTVGAYMGASAQKANLQSQARIAEINATLADQSARQELAASSRKQSEIKLRGAQVKAAQRAGYAGAGIDIAVGTPVSVATSTDFITETDANTAATNGLMSAWGRRMEASNARSAADARRAQARSISPLLTGASSLITGAGQVAQSWYGLNKVGTFGGGGSSGFADPNPGRSFDEAVALVTEEYKLGGWR